MSTTEELREAVVELVGCQVVEFSRTVNIAIVGFRNDTVEKRLHAQCPFRVTHRDQLLFGSADMRYRDTGDAETAFDEYRTKYDRQARQLTGMVTAHECFVTSADLGPAGLLSLGLDGPLTVTVLPACAGPNIEQWRLFDWHDTDRHYVYPDTADR
ncbi:hypothetical protein M8542_15915 [Amycolatopsis sp. OK19-0408]|uniref:Uncharacterized protein n=1 Tax=Amycolatopsis iheyensis TaxID=2945988 RepID=A0A9X2NCQ9_9PSEU|nr:hypothetical protein [Amycolatopsis iheyensis]MCR6484309.1 hypothetical protein [Amycolatopsis iheyensis]